MKSYFITGTDTDCGKTYVTCQLLAALRQRDKKALAIKPVATGTYIENGENYNTDLVKLEEFNGALASHFKVNNWLFPEPISPHLAAKKNDDRISIQEIRDFYQKQAFAKQLDYLFIEGAGGVYVPLNEQETWLDFLKLSQLPVILVVGIKLGCLNHALLTDFVLQQLQIPCLGWIANCLDPKMLACEENIATLQEKMSIPQLATLPYNGAFCDIIGVFS